MNNEYFGLISYSGFLDTPWVLPTLREGAQPGMTEQETLTKDNKPDSVYRYTSI